MWYGERFSSASPLHKNKDMKKLLGILELLLAAIVLPIVLCIVYIFDSEMREVVNNYVVMAIKARSLK